MDPIAPALQDGFRDSKNYSTDFVFGVGAVTKGVIISTPNDMRQKYKKKKIFVFIILYIF